MVFSYAGTGRIPQFTAIKALGLISYSYNSSVGEEFLYLDFGNLTINYWIIENHADVVIADYQNSQIISLTEDNSTNFVLDYGTITQIESVGVEDWGLITVSSNITSFGFLHYQSLSTWRVVNAWVGSGTVWEFGGSRFRLDAPWIGSGTLRVEGRARSNYVPNVTARALLPLRSDTKISFTPNWNSFGEILSTGDTSYSTTKVSPQNIQSLISIDTDVRIVASLSHIGSGYLFSINNAAESNTFNYKGSGFILSFNQEVKESVSWDYNLDSIVYFEYQDYGLVSEPVIDSIVIQDIANDTIQQYQDVQILDMVYPGSSSGQFIDHGYLLVENQDPPETLQRDWGYIWETYTKYPMGLGRLRGVATEKFVPSYVGTCEISITGEGIGKTKPRWIAYVLSSINGRAITTFSLLHIGSGTLFNLSNGEYSTTYDYSGLGDLYAFSGAAEIVGFNPPDITTDIKISGQGSVAFTPNWVSEGNITIDIESTEKNVSSWVGSGSIFSFETKVERRVYSYNSSSEVLFTNYDYGLVSESVINSIVIQDIANDTIQQYASTKIIDLVYSGSGSGSYYDYGFIIEDGADKPETVTDDYEYILETFSRYPFGDLTFVGAADTNISPAYNGSGNISISGSGRGRTEPKWTAYIQISVSGVSNERITNSFAGYGKLYGIVSTTESRTYDYYGSGSLFTINNVEEVVSFNPPQESSVILVSGEAYVAFTPNWNGSGLLNFAGELISEKSTFSEVGQGSLFAFETKVERRVYSYNTTSIDEFVHTDYGLVSLPAIDSWIIANHANVVIFDYKNNKIIDLTESGGTGSYLDYGFLQLPLDAGLRGTQNPADAQYDYQYILDSSTIYPFGRLQLGLSSVDTKTVFSLLHVGNLEGTQIKITGEVFIRLPNIQLGSGTLFGFGGASESSTVREIKDGLFKFVGKSAERFIPNHNGSGTILLSGFALQSFTGSRVKEGYIWVRGNALESFVVPYNGSGNLYGFSGSAEVFSANPPDITTDIKFVGAGTQRSSVSNVGFGNLFAFSGSTESASTAEEKSITIKISGAVSERYVPNWNGSGSISTLSGSAESFTASPDELQGLFSFVGFGRQRFTSANSGITEIKLSGTTQPEILTFAEQPSGSIFIFGDAQEPRGRTYIGSGRISTLSGAAESVTFNPEERQILFSLLGRSSQSFTFGNYEGNASLKVSGGIPKDPTLTFSESIVGNIQVFGATRVRFLDNHLGEGVIFAKGLVSESITIKLPPTREANILLRGGALESISFNPPDITTDIVISGSVSTPILTFSEEKFVYIFTSGNAVERNTESYSGSGSFFTNGISGESVSRKLPAFTADVQIFGNSTESVSVRETFFGSLFAFRGSSSPEKLSFAEQPQTLGRISGAATERHTESYIGSGRIATLSGASESVSFNPEERQILFSVLGIARLSASVTEVKFVKSRIFAEDIRIQVSKSFIGSETVILSGNAKTNFALRHIGSGRIATLSGAAESVTFNPEEKQILFSVLGNTLESKTKTFIGSGLLFTQSGASESRVIKVSQDGLFTFNGLGVYSSVKTFIGSGILFDFGSVQVKASFAYQAEASVSISGIASESNTEVYTGTGSLYAFAGSSESSTYSPDLNLFDINLYGAAKSNFALRHIGSGYLYALSGSAESRTFAYQNVSTFEFVGTAKRSVSKAYVGEGTIEVSGSANTFFIPKYPGFGNVYVFAEDVKVYLVRYFTGSGRISTLSGAAESVTFNPEEKQILFSFTGSRSSERVTVSEITEGSINVSGIAIDKFVRGPYPGYTQIKVADTSPSSITKPYIAETSVVSISGKGVATKIQRYTGVVNTRISGDATIGIRMRFFGSGALHVTGSGKISYTPSGVETLADLYVLGFAATSKVQVAPERTYGWII